MSAARPILGFLLLSILLVPITCADTLVSVGFTGVNVIGGPSATNSGVESAAAAEAEAEDPLFSSANVWNALSPSNTAVPNSSNFLLTNPTWTDLVDSTGARTTINFSITGTVGIVSVYNPSIPGQTDILQNQYMFWNSNSDNPSISPPESDLITWQITGLAPDSAYDIFVYGTIADFNRNFDMTINGITLPVVSLNGVNPGGTLFANVQSDGSGTISGIGTGIGSDVGPDHEANWSGFQIVQTPESSSILLLGSGLLCVVGIVFRSRRLA